MWLVVVALTAIVLLSLVFHREQLFLIGAIGGLMSRMTRSLFREDVPTDYGASWTTLFLSPLLGAIAAWFGIAAVILLVRLEVLGPKLAQVEWDPPLGATTVIIAFALGFSERLFTSLLSSIEGRVTDDPNRPPARGGGGGTGAGAKPPAAPPPNPNDNATGITPGTAATRVTVRLAIDGVDTLEPGSLALTIDDVAESVPPTGMLEVPLEIGREHRIAATARRGGVAVQAEQRFTPTLDSEGQPMLLTLKEVSSHG
jgi:hypothetical protein